MKQELVTAALIAAIAITSAHSQTTTPDSVKTRLGALTFERGYPTEETTRKLFDETDYQRAVQARMAPSTSTSGPPAARSRAWRPTGLRPFVAEASTR